MAYLSVTIPTKNRPELLERALRSVLDQDEDVQVVVIDDGSSATNRDRIVELCSDPRVVLHRNDPSKGAPAGRNQGLALADATYWATLDDDDQWLPGKWAAQRAILEAHGSHDDVVVVTAIRPSVEERDVARHAPRLEGVERPASLSKLLDKLPLRVFLNSYVVPTALMRSIGGYDERFIWGEHTDLLIRLMAVARFAGTDHVGVLVDRWHEDAGSRTGRDATLKVAGVSLLLEKHRAVFAREPELRRLYRHILGIAQLRTGDRWGAVKTLGKTAASGPGVKPRVRALGHLAMALTPLDKRLRTTAPGDPSGAG
jgi:glycosyltransferase involved in cell wall biosynthesis